MRRFAPPRSLPPTAWAASPAAWAVACPASPGCRSGRRSLWPPFRSGVLDRRLLVQHQLPGAVGARIGSAHQRLVALFVTAAAGESVGQQRAIVTQLEEVGLGDRELVPAGALLHRRDGVLLAQRLSRDDHDRVVVEMPVILVPAPAGQRVFDPEKLLHQRHVEHLLSRHPPLPGQTHGYAEAMYAGPISRLITELGKLPGIGQRTAQRLAFHVLRADPEDALALADAIREVKEKVGLCEVCFNLAEGPRCRICLDERRDPSLICVVEEPGDVIPVERTHEFRGLYHVLGGALSPIDGVDPEDLKIAELYRRVTAAAEQDEPVAEVVLATNPTTTGEATALHIAAGLRERAPEVQVTRLASGLPVGADLEYADEVTLGKALAGRRTL